MRYYNVIPFINLPLTKNPSFTYSSDSELEFGTIVQIPFGKRTVLGISTQKTTRPRFATKKISKIIERQYLDKQQFSLAQFIAEYYLTSLGVVLRFFYQKSTKKTVVPKMEKQTQNPFVQLTSTQKTAAKKIILNKQNSFLLFGPASSGKTEVVMTVAEEILKKKDSQIAIFVPEIFLAYQEFERYAARFKQHQTFLYHSSLKPSEGTFIKKGLRNGTIRILITTRAGLFLPFKNLKLIAIDEEQDISYKQWNQSPFYQTRTIAARLAENHKAKLILMSGTPSLETLNKTISNNLKIQVIKLPMLKTGKLTVKKPEIILVDLLKDYKTKQKILISATLKAEVEKNLDKKELTLVLVPRKGKSSYSFCKDCRKALMCPDCETPLVHIKDSYQCLHCSYKKSVITKCKNCGSFRIISVGMGTQSVSAEFEKLFPAAKIFLADSDTFQHKTARIKLFKKLKNKEMDILIGTYGIAKGFDFPNISLTAILNADNWAGQSNFSFDEHFLSSLFQLAGRVNRPKSKQNGRCVIQTFHPQSKTFQLLKKWDWEKFAKDELTTRENLNYPPFVQLLKLTITEETLEALEKRCKKVYNSLLKMANKNITLSVPYFGHDKKRRGQWKKHILLKINGGLSGKDLAKLKKTGSLCKIDVDVESIF